MPILGILSSSYYVPPSTFDHILITVNGVVTYSTDGTNWAFKKAFTRDRTANFPAGRERRTYYANGNFISEMNTNVIYTSTDATSWSPQEVNMYIANSLIYQGSTYYKTGNNVIQKSTDLVTWTAITIPTFASTTAFLAYGNSTFVFVNSSSTGGVLTSTDGVTWTSRTFISVTDLGVINLKYVNNLFIAVGNFTDDSIGNVNVGLIVTSTDGITWTQRTPASGINTNTTIGSVAYGNSKYVIGLQHQKGIQYSTDAITWSTGLDSASNGNRTIIDIAYGSAAGFAAYAQGPGGTSAPVWKSTDGVSWTETSITNGNVTSTRSVAYGNGTYCFVSTYNSTAGTNVWTSTDLVTYTAVTPALIKGAVYDTLKKTNNYYFAYGSNAATSNFGTLTFSYSTDLTTWTEVSPTSDSASTMYELSYGNGTYAVFYNLGKYSTSTDLVTWTTRTALVEATQPRGDVVYADNKFVASFSTGRISTSTDAITWTSRTSNLTSTLSSLTYTNNLFIVAGSSGQLATSTDAITWTSRTTNLSITIYDSAYGNGKYVITSGNGVISTSTDTVTWTSSDLGDGSLFGVYYDGSKWYIIFSGLYDGLPTRYTSTDAVTWTLEGYNDKNQSNVNSYRLIVE